MATFKNELSLDAKQHNLEMNNAANSVKQYDKKIRDAEKSARSYIASLRLSANSAKAHARELDAMKGKLSSVAQAFGAGSTTADVFGTVLTKGLASAMKFSVGLAGVTTALKVAKDAFFSSESNVDEWGRTVAGAEGIYQSFVSAINSGNFSGFISNLNSIIAKARDAYDALDNLNTMMTIINPERAKLQALVNRNREILNDPNASAADKAAARGALQGLKPQLEGSYKKEGEMNRAYVENAVKNKLAQKGIFLDKNSFNFVIESLADTNKYNTLVRNARGSLSAGTTIYTSAGIPITTGAKDTRNTNAKIVDALTDAFRADLAPYVGRIYSAEAEGYAQGRSINRALTSGSSGGGSRGGGTSGGPGRGGSTEPVYKVDFVPDTTDLTALVESFKIDPPKVEIPADFQVVMHLNDLIESATKTLAAAFSDEWLNIDNMEEYIQKCIELGISYDELAAKLEKVAELNKLAFALTTLGGAIETLGGKISSLGGTVANVIGTVATSVGLLASLIGLVMAFAAAQAVENAFALPFPANIPAYASVIGMIGSAVGIVGGIVGKFANGGMVEGSTTIGDYNLARVNGGEMILNGAQQLHLWNLINANNSTGVNTFNGGKVEFIIKGKNLVGTLNNYDRKQSKI